MNIYIILSFIILLGLVVCGMIERKALRGELAKERQEHINLIRTYETFRAYHEQYEKESIKWDAVDFVNYGEIIDIEISEESAKERDGFINSPEARQKMKEASSIKVFVYDLNNNFIGEYESGK